MSVDEFFDVLSINDENGNVDMIQVLMGNDCLGSYFINGTAKLYFQSGLKSNLETRLQKINSMLCQPYFLLSSFYRVLRDQSYILS